MIVSLFRPIVHLYNIPPREKNIDRKYSANNSTKFYGALHTSQNILKVKMAACNHWYVCPFQMIHPNLSIIAHCKFLTQKNRMWYFSLHKVAKPFQWNYFPLLSARWLIISLPCHKFFSEFTFLDFVWPKYYIHVGASPSLSPCMCARTLICTNTTENKYA